MPPQGGIPNQAREQQLSDKVTISESHQGHISYLQEFELHWQLPPSAAHGLKTAPPRRAIKCSCRLPSHPKLKPKKLQDIFSYASSWLKVGQASSGPCLPLPPASATPACGSGSLQTWWWCCTGTPRQPPAAAPPARASASLARTAGGGEGGRAAPT